MKWPVGWRIWMTNVALRVDVDTEIYPTGLKTLVYIGDTDAPQVDSTESWEEIIPRTVQYFTTKGKIAECHRDEIDTLISGLRNALELFESTVEEVGYYEE
jgi:hypothetical protein